MPCTKRRCGPHLKRAPHLHIFARRLAECLPLCWPNLDRQYIGKWRIAETAWPKAVITAQHNEPHAGTNMLCNGFPTISAQPLYIDVVKNDDVRRTLSCPGTVFVRGCRSALARKSIRDIKSHRLIVNQSP